MDHRMGDHDVRKKCRSVVLSGVQPKQAGPEAHLNGVGLSVVPRGSRARPGLQPRIRP